MAAIIAHGSPTTAITAEQLSELVATTLSRIADRPRKVLLLPPDHTRLISRAGEITALLYRMLSGSATVEIMPALGTHAPMTPAELRQMFGETIPLAAFRVHNWRDEVVLKGTIGGDRLAAWSEGRVDYPVRVEVNRILFQGYDLILSIGQVLPHEVVGMANYTKNIMVGVGGADTINKSHFLGAVYNMERILGRADNPVRRLFNAGVGECLGDLPICYLLTVVGRDADTGTMSLRGFFAGRDEDAFLQACALSRQVNITRLAKPLSRVVAYLDPHEFRSTWLGNKAVYRTRMAIADGGELLVLAPGVKEFGEDREIDRLIRKYGYRGTPATLAAVAANTELRENLSAAAHLIHGSSEGRFTITYAPGHLTRAEIEAAGFRYADPAAMLAKYPPDCYRDGWNRGSDGEEFFFIGNPASGLWAQSNRLD